MMALLLASFAGALSGCISVPWTYQPIMAGVSDGAPTSGSSMWSYRPHEPIQRRPLIDKTVAVVPLVDCRNQVNRDGIPLLIFPLVPYATIDYGTPETQQVIGTNTGSFRPPEDIAMAIAAEYANSGLFKEAFFTYREREGDLVLRGEILSTNYHAWCTFYGLSIPGEVLWLFDLPVGGCRNELVLKLSLFDRTSDKVIWSNTYTESTSQTVRVWSAGPPFCYAQLMKRIMARNLEELPLNLGDASVAH